MHFNGERTKISFEITSSNLFEIAVLYVPTWTIYYSDKGFKSALYKHFIKLPDNGGEGNG